MAITSITRKHASDAAFYWQNINASRLSALISRERLGHYHRLLQANLDGLVAAGEDGYQLAYKNLLRFKTQGEAFVAWYLALALNKPPEILTELSDFSGVNYDTVWDGVVSAHAYLAGARLNQKLQDLFKTDIDNDSFNLGLGVAVAAVRRIAIAKEVFKRAFNHKNFIIRLQLAKYLGNCPEKFNNTEQLLLSLFNDGSRSVIEGATLASIRRQPRLPDLKRAENLLNCIKYRLQVIKEKKGLVKLLSQRRMDLLASYLGHAVPLNYSNFSVLLEQLPVRLKLIAIAHHGSVNYLPLVIKSMEDKAHAPLAFWAFCFISDINDDDEQFIEFTEESNEEKRIDEISAADVGLNRPNVLAIKKWYQQNSSKLDVSKIMLKGQPATFDNCARLFNHQHSVQALRFAAALQMKHLAASEPWLDNRAPAFVNNYLI